MNRLEFIALHGERKTAQILTNKMILQVCGLSMEDLPDTAEIWAFIDELEEILKQEPGNTQKILDKLCEITQEWVETICM